MTESTPTAPALSALNTTAALATANIAQVRAEGDNLFAAQAAYGSILARAAAGEDVPEIEFEAAEHTMNVVRRRLDRRVAVARIHALAMGAIIPAARAETETQQAEGQAVAQ